MRLPLSTYRVQFNKDFRFADARELLPFLRRVGIGDLYASPVFQARKGSMHGYDVTDPTQINSELGTPEDFAALVADLRQHGMGLLLDIVPNHMAASPENPWWMDVLENGSSSPYASYFDVEWGHRSPSVQDEIVLPILGEPYGTVLENGQLKLGLTEHGFRVSYYETALPLDPATYHEILSFRLDEFLRGMGQDDPALHEFGLVLERAEHLPGRSAADWDEVELRLHEIPELKAKLWAVYQAYPAVRDFLDENIRLYNGAPGDPGSFDRLDCLLNKQPYLFTFWRAARERINYRRFFDVTDLIGIRAQDPRVFHATHETALRWMETNTITGLRIDHVDGLYDPLAYLAQLQARASQAAGTPVYITAEKILSGDETLPSEWPIAGTTGYDFLGAVNNLFVHPEGLRELTRIYREFVGDDTTFYHMVYTQKKKIMEDLFAGELRTLGFHLSAIAQRYRHARDLSPEALNTALLEATASMPVYRTYTRDFRIGAKDRAAIEDAIRSARIRNPALAPACFDFLQRVLLVQLSEDEDALRFVMRWQQITGPIMAKGVEDTTLYRYNRLTSMNEVGGSPEAVSLARFHEFNAARLQQWPGGLNATSTHDTKRSEDVRARIHLLSEMAGEWGKHVNRWHRWNRTLTGSLFPQQDPNQCYLLYQTLLGAWPLDDRITDEFVERIKAYMIKSAREAKAHTSWLRQNEEYEKSMLQFTEAILREGPSNRFLPDFRNFQKRIAFFGAITSLAQTLLKIVCPGVPDFYQGTVLWDFSLVDPDNRRPAQISPRLEMLPETDEWTPKRLVEAWPDGRVKAFLILRALRLRRELLEIFEGGEYLPLEGTELAQEHTVALARRRENRWVIAVAPRFLTQLTALEKMPIGRRFWKNSAILLPPGAPSRWRNAFTQQDVETPSGRLAVSDALLTFPVSLLHGESPRSG